MSHGVEVVEEGFEDVFQVAGTDLPERRSPATPQSRSSGHSS